VSYLSDLSDVLSKAVGRMKGLNEIRAMTRALQGDGPVKRRLAVGAEAFWSATLDADTWPEAVQAHAEQLQCRLLAEGPIRQTVAQLEDQAALEILQDLLRFAASFREDP